ncbi:P-loop containing nucleoside triphosphate hydrolase protein [Aspergillus karnatakaensis]|uniref:P-loop containing nucleoside triphosphate hydrolase protein n=1 Tax=Aspergillus karnatakaensis TaxID=1810916 RepID=UPI003CCDAE38
MEQFLLENVKRYQTLVERFTPPRTKEAAKNLQTSPNLTVATRIRPILEKELQSGQVSAVFPRQGEDATVDIHELRNVPRGWPLLNSYTFSSDRTFAPEHTTDEIYDEIVKPLLPWVMQGKVGTLFAYGQTGSGKTFTVSGLERLIARDIFKSARASRRKIHISFVELAGNSGYDLLNNRHPIQILEDAFGETQLVGAIETASSFRQTAPTTKNDGSSRSHAICRLRIEDATSSRIKAPRPDGILYMIDLAGSEAARDIASHSADRMKETREINVSLSTLKDCIRAVASMDIPSSSTTSSSTGGKKGSAKKPYIPFRQSALTKVLKHLFDPDSTQSCKTVILACINPSFLDVGASKNTLRYAEMLRVALPKNTKKGVEIDMAVPATWGNKDVRNWIKWQSGRLAISAYDLAPTETGLQLLRLPAEEFVQRCLETPGVTEEQARAFHSKLWELHVKSQRDRPTGSQVQGSTDKITSRDPDIKRVELPFQDRIRPGMVVRWTPPVDFAERSLDHNLILVLAPDAGSAGEKKYLCALVLPGTLGGAYEVHLWRQVVVSVGDMEAEVLLEYDSATRYYHVVV